MLGGSNGDSGRCQAVSSKSVKRFFPQFGGPVLIWSEAKELWGSAGLVHGSARHCPNAPVRSEIKAAELSPDFPGQAYLVYLLPTIDLKDL